MKAPAPGPVKDVVFPRVARATLPNGLQILVAERHQLPTAYVLLTVRAGSASDPPDRPGLAPFLGDMLLEGTRTRTRAALLDAIEFVGGDLRAGADEDRLTIGAQTLSEHLGTAIELVADVARAPLLPADSVEKVRAQTAGDLERNLSDPGFLARRLFTERVYGAGHAYAQVSATPTSIAAITREELCAWHAERVGPGAAFLVVAGDVRPEEVFALAERHFGAWSVPAPVPAEPPAPARPASRTTLLVDRPGSVQAQFHIGAPALRRGDAGWIRLQVGHQVLGGSASSRLFLRLREEKSLTYGAYTRLEPRRGVGLLWAGGSSRNEVASEALGEFYGELARIRDAPIAADEMDAAQGYLVGLFPTQVETPANVAGMIAQIEVCGLPRDYWDTYRTGVQAVTAAEARAAVASVLDPDRVLSVVVGDARAIREPLERHGPVTVVDAFGAARG